MSIAPHIDPNDPNFPGDSSPQSAFGLKDSFRSIFIWSIGAPHLTFWALFTVFTSKLFSQQKTDGAIKMMMRLVPWLAGVKVKTKGPLPKAGETHVYIANHVNIFDMFVLYQSIPSFTRSLEHIDHFSWPLYGQFITAAGQIPVNPGNRKETARGLKIATDMLKSGDCLAVMPEGSRTLDGSVGKFFPGAFRLAIKAGVSVIPMAIHGGRKVSRRGDWRVRPGKITVIYGEPVSSKGLKVTDAQQLADKCRQSVIELLQSENRSIK